MAPSRVVAGPDALLSQEGATSGRLGGTVTLPADRGPATRRRPVVAPFAIPEPPAPKPKPVVDRGREGVPFYPNQAISSLTASFIIMSLLTVLTIFLPAGLQAKADPNLTPAHVKPEWPFLFLYEFLHFVPTIVGLLAPLAAIAALVALPFLDRNPERAPRKRLLAIAGCFVVVSVIGFATVSGYLE